IQHVEDSLKELDGKQEVIEFFNNVRLNEEQEQALEDLDVSKDFIGYYEWEGLLDNDFQSKVGLNLDDYNDTINYLEVNRIIANIEMHKVLFGDPYQLKEKDILKRKKTSLSPNSTTPISPVYDQNMRKKGNILSDGYELKEGDLGFVEYSDHAETSTVADIVTKSKISSIEVPNTYKNKEQLDHLLKEYGAGKIEVTDGSAYGN